MHTVSDRKKSLRKPDFKALPASNQLALAHLLLPLALAFTGTWLSTAFNGVLSWLAGQLLLAVFFFQCFVLLHETGHLSYFKSKSLNKFFGHLFGFLSFIPYESWAPIHHLHHRWTGWRDKDPTTEGTVAPKFSQPVRALVNLCWKLGLPLFTIGYRLGNYWSPKKLQRYLPQQKLNAIYLNQALLLLVYGLAFYFWGGWILKSFGLAYLLSMALSDLIILSQHSHIDMPVAAGQEVKPISYSSQVPYTRSLRLNAFVARFILFNFNLHELHHAYPGVPAYYLSKLDQDTPNSKGFWRYLFKAKKMSGVDFVFNTSKKTGVEV
ncbi:fatty acid desaturase family protein [Botryobacter ruber]|uniref:fatty acid desaturase family protein n=1 Tax=Botryobacter ruber TaxID=2171629 RepID=UPI000E0C103F|nr:fatty acid desaturase [Botryobacter ruber]